MDRTAGASSPRRRARLRSIAACGLWLLCGCLEISSSPNAGGPDGSTDEREADAGAAPAVATTTDSAVVSQRSSAFDGGSQQMPLVIEESYPACEVTDAGEGDSAGEALEGGADAQVALGAGKGPLTVLVVFDKSTSMDARWDHRSRWHAASDAMLAAMEPLAKQLTVGALLFPTLGQCHVAPHAHERQIPFLPGKDFIDAWQAQVCWPHEPWSTPLGLALEEADRAIARAEEDGRLEDRFRVMIVTDGEPNCGYSRPQMERLVSRWAELGVETHVLGLPGSGAAAELLDALAAAGGTEAHQSPGTPEEFEEQTTALLL